MSDLLGQIAEFYDADNRRLTEYERYAATPKGAIELEAAKVHSDAIRLLRQTSKSSPLTHEEVGQLLGVTADRVRDVLGDGVNLTVAALAKYLGAHGYRLEITTQRIEEPDEKPLHSFGLHMGDFTIQVPDCPGCIAEDGAA